MLEAIFSEDPFPANEISRWTFKFSYSCSALWNGCATKLWLVSIEVVTLYIVEVCLSLSTVDLKKQEPNVWGILELCGNVKAYEAQKE